MKRDAICTLGAVLVLIGPQAAQAGSTACLWAQLDERTRDEFLIRNASDDFSPEPPNISTATTVRLIRTCTQARLEAMTEEEAFDLGKKMAAGLVAHAREQISLTALKAKYGYTEARLSEAWKSLRADEREAVRRKFDTIGPPMPPDTSNAWISGVYRAFELAGWREETAKDQHELELITMFFLSRAAREAIEPKL